MRWRPAAHPHPVALPVAGAAVAGAVLGHWPAYLLTVPQSPARARLLAETSHGYWPTALATAWWCCRSGSIWFRS